MVETARAIDAACSESGFFIVTGHGVQTDLVEQVLDVGRPPELRPVLERYYAVMEKLCFDMLPIIARALEPVSRPFPRLSPLIAPRNTSPSCPVPGSQRSRQPCSMLRNSHPLDLVGRIAGLGLDRRIAVSEVPLVESAGRQVGGQGCRTLHPAGHSNMLPGPG